MNERNLNSLCKRLVMESELHQNASPEAGKHTSISRLFSASTMAAPIVDPDDKRATFRDTMEVSLLLEVSDCLMARTERFMFACPP